MAGGLHLGTQAHSAAVRQDCSRRYRRPDGSWAEDGGHGTAEEDGGRFYGQAVNGGRAPSWDSSTLRSRHFTSIVKLYDRVSTSTSLEYTVAYHKHLRQHHLVFACLRFGIVAKRCVHGAEVLSRCRDQMPRSRSRLGLLWCLHRRYERFRTRV